MLLYLDLNCFNRPFNDQSQVRIRRETEAIYGILSRILEGTDLLLWSWALDWENARHPIADRREEIGVWRHHAVQVVELTLEVEAATRKLSGLGVAPLDAAHLACAGAAGVEVFLTCDDRLEARARQLIVQILYAPTAALPFRVLNPVLYWEWVTEHG